MLRDNTNIYVDNYSEWKDAIYQSRARLTNNGYPEYLYRSIMIDARDYLHTFCQGSVLLRELAHAWQDQYLGYNY